MKTSRLQRFKHAKILRMFEPAIGFWNSRFWELMDRYKFFSGIIGFPTCQVCGFLTNLKWYYNLPLMEVQCHGFLPLRAFCECKTRAGAFSYVKLGSLSRQYESTRDGFWLSSNVAFKAEWGHVYLSCVRFGPPPPLLEVRPAGNIGPDRKSQASPRQHLFLPKVMMAFGDVGPTYHRPNIFSLPYWTFDLKSMSDGQKDRISEREGT